MKILLEVVRFILAFLFAFSSNLCEAIWLRPQVSWNLDFVFPLSYVGCLMVAYSFEDLDCASYL